VARGLFFEVNPSDPILYAATAGVVALAAALAIGWPAMRAARVDPAGALRQP
jgi:ABC-type lipoprotein release transport system permease subunit